MRQEFASGFMYWWRGWGLLRRSRALGFYAVLPFLLASTFFVSVLWVSYEYIPELTDYFLHRFFPEGAVWHGLFYYPTWIMLFILAFVALIYLSYLVHVVVCGPFYSLLADRALHDLGKSVKGGFRVSAHAMIASAIKATIFLAVGACLFIFSMVPLINAIGLFIALLILAFDTMDYSFEAMGMGLRARMLYFAKHTPQWLGMASALALTMAVPGLTLLILPGAVVGAAMIFEKEG